MSNRVACETLDAMCSVCGVHCATWRTEDADGDGHWTLDVCDAFGWRWLVHHDNLLEAVVLRCGFRCPLEVTRTLTRGDGARL